MKCAFILARLLSLLLLIFVMKASRLPSTCFVTNSKLHTISSAKNVLSKNDYTCKTSEWENSFVQKKCGIQVLQAASELITDMQDENLSLKELEQKQKDEDAELRRSLESEFYTIGLPALAGLTAEPLASFVDSAFLGRLGPVALGAAGVALTAQYSFSKLYNDPLLRTTTSMVAGEKDTGLSENVSAALMLASFIGVIQCAFFLLLAPQIVGNIIGTKTASLAMREPAINYLRFRSLGGPASCLLIVSQGIFRGLGDTTTPLKCTLVGNAINVVLDALFIGKFHWGCAGAAAATSLGNYAAVFLLLKRLRQRTSFSLGLKDLKGLIPSLKAYVSAGSLVLARSFGKVWGYAYAGKVAAMLGTASMAAYNLTFQLGVATTQLVEAVSIAAQSLLARELAGDDPRKVKIASRFVIRHGLKLSLGLSGLLSAITYLGRSKVLKALTSDPTVQSLAAEIMPIVLLAQIAKGLAYPTNGIILGGQDWSVSTISMWASSIFGVGLLWRFVSLGHNSLFNIWVALTSFFVVQVITSTVRFASNRGVWSKVDILNCSAKEKGC